MAGEKRARVKRGIPNMFTLGNAVCGFSAIICALKSDSTAHLLVIAAGLIFLAMVFDALDGRVARTIGVTSDLGANLDSLCDAVSFGLAPAVVLFQLLSGALWTPLIWIGGVFYVGCAIYRLARFNVETGDHSEDAHLWFSGLPSTGAATVVCLRVHIQCVFACLARRSHSRHDCSGVRADGLSHSLSTSQLLPEASEALEKLNEVDRSLLNV